MPIHASFPLIVPRLNVSVSIRGRDWIFDGKSSTSPNRNAALSRPEPDTGRLVGLRNGGEDLGGDDFMADAEGVSGSSIHEKLDCAIVDRVGTGAFGLCCGSSSFAGSTVICCKFVDGIATDAAVIAGALLSSTSRL